MQSSALLQILPRIPPPSCGVGDYALRLAEALTGAGGPPSVYITAQNQLCLRSEDPLLQSVVTTPHSKTGLFEAWQSFAASPPQSILLHYSGYGYAKRGAPFWLLRAVRHFRRQYPSVPWLTMFHEVAASGPVTTSAFWLQPLQEHIAKKIFQLSTVAFTNCSVNANHLLQLAPQEKVKLSILPVFSNFGELATPPPPTNRLPHLILFSSNLAGRPPSQDFWNNLSATIARLSVTQVTIIGRPVASPPPLSVPLVQTGFLDVSEVSALLATTRFGYAYYAPLMFGRSTIFAAFAANGVIPIVPNSSVTLPEDLRQTEHFLSSSDDQLQWDLKKIQSNLIQWYRPHNLAATAQAYLASLHLPV
jgi:hypothetical protein